MIKWVINDVTDLRTWAANTYPDLSNADHDAIAEFLRNLDHPPYSRDWTEWLDTVEIDIDTVLA
jgi:hypothetical protein